MLKRIRDLLGRRGTNPAPGHAEAPSAERGRRKGAAAEAAAKGELPPIHHGPRVVHQPIATADLDDDAVKIVKRLTRFDHAAYLVGGCVRDLLLDRKPKDFDIGTSATPRQIKRVFRNCRIIGRRFRLAHIYFQNGKIIEVATFRAADGQDAADDEDLLIRDDNVFGTPEEDALRRDFTINALFYDVNNETVLDHTDGLGDLRRRLIRTIGDPEIRFREDPIRILRAIKFAARLEFDIERSTLDALRRTKSEIPKAAAPRILEELNRFSRGGAARRSFELMRDTGVFEVVLPELEDDYAGPRAWEILGHALDGLVASGRKAGREVRTGEIFAALLAWPVGRTLGWSAQGEARSTRGVDLPQRIDDPLRPVALRLRVPRREQELCRQLLLTLARMVPASKLHRNTKRAILRRTCLPEAMVLLEACAKAAGGAFTEALESWQATLEARGPAEPERGRAAKPQQAGEAAGDDEQPPSGKKRRRRRRGGRRRKRDGADDGAGPAPAEARADGEHGKAAAEDGDKHKQQRQAKDDGQRRDRSGGGGGKKRSEKKPARKDGMPPPWDERYFFAALPSVPEKMTEQGRARYGGDLVDDDERDDRPSDQPAGARRDRDDDRQPDRDDDRSRDREATQRERGEDDDDAPRGRDDASSEGRTRSGRSRRGRRGGRRRRRKGGGGNDGGNGGGESDGERDAAGDRHEVASVSD